jgi:hypothetical protein
VITITNKSEYPTREVKKLVRKTLGYADITDGISVVVTHFQKKTWSGERTWMGGWYDPRKREIVAKIVKPGWKPTAYYPYQRKPQVAPTFELRDWREQLVALVAHEAHHHRQRRRPKGNRFVEVECDLAAYRAVQYLREDEGRP